MLVPKVNPKSRKYHWAARHLCILSSPLQSALSSSSPWDSFSGIFLLHFPAFPSNFYSSVDFLFYFKRKHLYKKSYNGKMHKKNKIPKRRWYKCQGCCFLLLFFWCQFVYRVWWEGNTGLLLTCPVSAAHRPFNKLKSADLAALVFNLNSSGLIVVRFNPLFSCCVVIELVRVTRHCFLKGSQTVGVWEQTSLAQIPQCLAAPLQNNARRVMHHRALTLMWP